MQLHNKKLLLFFTLSFIFNLVVITPPERRNMFKKVNVKRVLELIFDGNNNSTIASMMNASRSTVIRIRKINNELKLSYEDIEKLDNDQLYDLFFPDKFKDEKKYALPDYTIIRKELKREGVNLALLWNEYVNDCTKINVKYCSYPTYCRLYNDYLNSIEHTNGYKPDTPGEYIDLYLVDISTDIYPKDNLNLFVGILRYSKRIFIKPIIGKHEEDWITANLDIFYYFGGTPKKIRCLSRYVNERYINFLAVYDIEADYVYTIKDGKIRNILLHVLARLRNCRYKTIEEFTAALSHEVDIYNSNYFKNKQDSRDSLFEREEKGLLKPFPPTTY